MMIKRIFPLFFILILGLGLRLYKISSPIADHHSWRQADSSSVIRNLSLDFDVFRPHWDNLLVTNAKSLPNPNGYFFEDFPLSFDIYPALFYRIFGTNIITLRMSVILFSLLTTIFLYFLIEDLSNRKIAILSAGLYAVLPYSIFFSRGVFQEVPLNFYAVTSIFFLNRYLKKEKTHLLFFAILFNALLFLTKPYSLVFLLPEMFLFFQKYRISLVKNSRVYLFFLASLIPFAAWWFWARQFPEGIPYSAWLFNEGNIRFKGAFFQWIFADRIGSLILGYFGVLFFGVGLFVLTRFKDGVFYFWLIGLLVYAFVIAKGNVTHDYYQIPFLIPIVYFSGKGIEFLFQLQKKLSEKVVATFFILIFLLFSIAFSWYRVRDFYNITSGIDLAGSFVDQNIPKNVLIIAGDGADPTLLYNCAHKGWAIGYGSTLENKPEVIEKLKNEGASYYVTTTVNQIKGTDFEKYMKSTYKTVKETDQFVVYALR